MDITLYQHDIAWAQPEVNRLRVEQVMANAGNTDIFVVPETFTVGFGDHMASLAEPTDGPTLCWAQQMAARYNTLFVGTWVVRDGDRCFNRLHWVYPDGTFGTYDKAHTFRPSGEYEQIGRGSRRPVFEYQGWRIRPAVCYDLRFPQWLRNDAMGYDLLLVCANWPASRREAWTTLLKARAIENLCYVAGCNRTGLDGNGGPYSGDSLIVNYKGQVIASGEQQDGKEADTMCIRATVDKERLDTFRQRWPFYLDFD